MGTSDGISTADWDHVHELALELLDTRTQIAVAARRQALLSHLATLEQKYGPLPSILATRADYEEDPATKEWLLLRAHALAEERCDPANLLYVAHSLAEFYVERQHDVRNGRHWLDDFKRRLVGIDDPNFREELARLSRIVEEIAGGDEQR